MSGVDHADLPSASHATMHGKGRSKARAMDSQRLVCCGLYFWLNMTMYSMSTFAVNYFQEHWSLAPTMFSYMSALGGISFFGAMFWCYVGTHRKRLLLQSLSVAHCLLYCLLFVLSHTPVVDNRILRCVLACSLYATASFCASGLYPLLDEAVVAVLTRHQNTCRDRSDFGQARAWSSVGSGVATVVSGYLFDQTQRYEPMILAMCLSTVFFVVLLCFLSCDTAMLTHKEQSGQSSAPTGNRREIFLFLSAVLVAGTGRSILANFYGLFLKENISKTDRFLLFGVVVRTAVEIATMSWEGAIARCIGYRCVFAIGLLANAVRLCGYAFFVTEQRYAVLFVVEAFRGLASSFVVSGGIRACGELAPRGRECFFIGVFSGVYGGLSTVVAGLFGGAVLEHTQSQQDTRKVFGVSTAAAAGGLVLYVCSCVPKTRRKAPLVLKIDVNHRNENSTLLSEG